MHAIVVYHPFHLLVATPHRIEGEDSSVSSRPSHHGGRRRRGIDRGDMFKTFSMVTLGVALVAQAPSLMTPDTVLAAEDDQQLNPSSRVVDSSMEEKADDEVDVQEEISTSTLISAQKGEWLEGKSSKP